MAKLLVALTLMLSASPDAYGQGLQADPARDRALHASIHAFLDNTISASQLDTDLREYARAFEMKPYKVGAAKIGWEKVPQERLFAFVRATARITAPAQQAFLKGELTATEAALKMAPFFLIWGGYGMDAPPDDPGARLRIDELLLEIGKFAGPADDASDLPPLTDKPGTEKSLKDSFPLLPACGNVRAHHRHSGRTRMGRSSHRRSVPFRGAPVAATILTLRDAASARCRMQRFPTCESSARNRPPHLDTPGCG